MKKTLIIFLLFITRCLSFDVTAQQQKFSFNEVYKVSDSPNLNVSTGDGDVTIYPSDKNEIEVFYIVERRNELLRLTREDLEEDFNIEISSGKDYLDISVKQKYQYRVMSWENRLNISFEIYAPLKTACDIQCSDGDIRIKGLSANQKLQSSDGDIDVLKINGDVYARTSDGDIYVNDIVGNIEPITSDGDIELKSITGRVEGRTSDGDVDLEDIKGDIKMISSDGDLNAENTNGEIRLTTSDGDIRLSRSNGEITLLTSDGEISFRNLEGSLKARTSDGEIKGNMLSLASSLELRTSDGSISVTIPGDEGLDLLIKGETINTDLNNFSGTSRDHLVDGTVNGGGTFVSLQASGGRVSLYYD